MHNEESDSFTVVKKKNRKNRKYIYTEKTLQDHVRDLDQKISILESSDTYHRLIEILDLTKISASRVISIRCLALGQPSESLAAMYQLALLILIARHLQVDTMNITAWDPVMTEMDIEIFKSKGILTKDDERVDMATVDSLDQDIRDSTDKTSSSSQDSRHSKNSENRPFNSSQDFRRAITLIYMLHAPISLTEAIFGQFKLDSCIIGNHLPDYKTKNMTDKELQTKFPEINQAIDLHNVQKAWIIQPIANSLSTKQPWWQAFNDMAVHVSKS